MLFVNAWSIHMEFKCRKTARASVKRRNGEGEKVKSVAERGRRWWCKKEYRREKGAVRKKGVRRKMCVMSRRGNVVHSTCHSQSCACSSINDGGMTTPLCMSKVAPLSLLSPVGALSHLPPSLSLPPSLRWLQSQLLLSSC